MAGYQTIEALRPILHRGPPAAPVVDRSLVQPQRIMAPLRGRNINLSSDVIAEIIARRERGESYSKISEALKVSHCTIRRHARHVLSPQGGWPNCWQTGKREPRVYNVEFAARLRRAGFSYDEIASELKCSNWTVIKLLDPSRRKLGGKAPVSDKLRQVAIVTGYNRRDLRKIDGQSSKDASLTKARHIAFWVLRVYRGLSYPVIGKSLGGYDHSTVIYGFARADGIAKALGISAEVKPRAAARALWAADWREVAQ